MNIHYQIDQIQKLDLVRIELWYSRGYKGKWALYDYDLDRTSPISFIAPGEGIFRFIIVAVDRWGRKSCGPSSGQFHSPPADFLDSIPPHLVVFVDYTAPKLYVLNPRGTGTIPQGRTLEIQWQGFDQNLTENPVTLFYQQPGYPDWIPIGQSLPAEGKYPWTPPEKLTGPIVIKAQMEDQAGNRDIVLSGPLNIISNKTELPAVISQRDGLSMNWQEPDATSRPFISPAEISSVSPELSRQERSQAFFRKGTLCRERQDWPEAAAAYEQVLQEEPDCLEARVNLGNIYYMMGKPQEAIRHLEICLQHKPNHPTALFNLAKTQLALNQCEKAVSTLDQLLIQDRRDWWAWLMRGDAADKLGKPQEALSSWQRAASGDLSAVKEQARQRIANYTP